MFPYAGVYVRECNVIKLHVPLHNQVCHPKSVHLLKNVFFPSFALNMCVFICTMVSTDYLRNMPKLSVVHCMTITQVGWHGGVFLQNVFIFQIPVFY